MEYHHRKYLADAAVAKLLSGFAMTEVGHGSNVLRLETTAIYDPETDAFVIDSPTSAGKKFIGNGASHGRLMTVFAQLGARFFAMIGTLVGGRIKKRKRRKPSSRPCRHSSITKDFVKFSERRFAPALSEKNELEAL